MFGYVRPLRGELRVRELDDYKAVYCGLCHTLGKRFGPFPRFFLNYDFTFLAMVLSSGEEIAPLSCARCAAAPFRGKLVCTAGKALETAADESVILTWWKLRDNVIDSGFWHSLAARILSILLWPAYRKASKLRPVFDASVRACLLELRSLEEEGCPSLDRTADTFARILQAASPVTEEPDRNRVLGQLLYHVGRWIYLIDAWDDQEKDTAAGRYNPVSVRFAGEEENARKVTMRTTLCHSLNLALSAFHLLNFGRFAPVISNVLYLGLPAVEEQVFRGEGIKRAGIEKTRSDIS
jgi:hypothetical protein